MCSFSLQSGLEAILLQNVQVQTGKCIFFNWQLLFRFVKLPKLILISRQNFPLYSILFVMYYVLFYLLYSGALLESSSNEFFLGFATNFQSPDELSIFVTTVESEPVAFAVSAVGFSFTGTATSNSSLKVAIPTTLQVSLGNNDREKGIRVKAEGDKTIVVYGLSYRLASSDAFLALPCSNLAVDEYEYFAVSYSLSGDGSSLILIVACENDTLVTTPTESFVLQQQQTYQIDSSLVDLTGTRVVSNKPISVFGAHQCADIPVTE